MKLIVIKNSLQKSPTYRSEAFTNKGADLNYLFFVELYIKQ